MILRILFIYILILLVYDVLSMNKTYKWYTILFFYNLLNFYFKVLFKLNIYLDK